MSSITRAAASTATRTAASTATRTAAAVAALAALLAGALLPGAGPAQAQTSGTRTSGFAYNATSGLLTQEVIEPGTPALRLQSDYVHDAFGNKTQVTVSGVDIATRSASTAYNVKGRFATSATNALTQSESRQYDERFGLPTSHTGPNGLTTTWTYDTFGRKTLEVRADGTRTTWSYQFCAGTAGGTAPCPTGGTHLVETKQLAADGSTPIAPKTIAYFDQLNRPIAGDTEGFDGSAIRASTEYDSQGRVLRKSRPYFVSGGTPQWTTFAYDTLGRVVTETLPDSTTVTRAYHGLTTSVTNALNQTSTTVKNSQDQVVSVTDAQSNPTSYVYEPFGNLVQVTDAAGNVTTATYDTRGRKISSSDPDLGVTTATWNVLDQLKTRTDAASLVTTATYDLLGRVTQRVESDLTSTWVYDSATNGIGKLASASTNTGYSRAHSYDSLGRPSQTQITVSGAAHAITTAYDAHSRVSSVTYPSGFAVVYSYNARGYQTELKNSATSQVYWTANARDAEQQLTQQTAGNGVATTHTFDPVTGRLTDIDSGASGAVQSFAYTYDLLGKLLSRADANTGLSETFGYDSLNRLTSATVALTPTPLVKTFTYNAIGNLTSKSDVGTYSYPAAGQPRPHAVTAISGGAINTTFTYDTKGNMTAGNGLTVAYTSYDKPSSITRGSNALTFSHDPEHQRFKQVGPGGTTLYLAGSGVLAEKFTGLGGAVEWRNYLVSAGGMVGVHVELPNETTLTRYFHKDHLGSIATITNESGVVLERLSYDAWGKRRLPNGEDDTAGAVTSQSKRGFTGHEQLDDVGLVHMNGRVYDPLLARFGTPDPVTEAPFSTQGWNRYAYVGNSPLNFTDPSGYCFMGCFWKGIGKAIGNAFRKVPILGAIVRIAAAAACGPICAGLASAFIVGVTGGDLGDAFRAGVIAMATAVAFNAVGFATVHNPSFLTPAHFANMAGHALVGCASSAASGGKCGAGALSGVVGSFAGPLMRGLSFEAKLIARTVLGGLAAVAGGGKFAHGAITGAFGYLFNDCGGGKGGCSSLVRGMMAEAWQWETLGPGAYHYYETSSTWICGGQDPSCSIANVRDAMLATQVPGYDGNVVDGGIYPVRLGSWYIGDVEIFDDDLEVSNVTRSNHLLHFGYITRTLEVRGDSIYLTTIGEGYNFIAPAAAANWWFGPRLFEQQAIVTRNFYSRHFGRR